MAAMPVSGTAAATLALARYRVTFEALEPLALPEYLGSTLRGAFGHAFRKLCCPAAPAAACPIPAACPYHLVFETAPPPDSQALRTTRRSRVRSSSRRRPRPPSSTVEAIGSCST